MHFICNLFLTLFFLSSCTRLPFRDEVKSPSSQKIESNYFLILLVEARHLDYSNNRSLLRTVAKHPSDGSKNSDVGHAWIYLQGYLDGQQVVLEGGHSGELGLCQPKYFEGVMQGMERGDQNPVAYLWSTLKDGFFQEGSGGHRPTFAAKINLTEEQFQQIIDFVQGYPYAEYSLTKNQCASFVADVAALAGLTLEHQITIHMEPEMYLKRERLLFWSDPVYSYLTLSSPDVLERSLIRIVQEGQAEYALPWYLKTHPIPMQECMRKTLDTLYHFPKRFHRYMLFK